MHFEYLKWDESVAKAIQDFTDMMSLFNFLLLQASGDVDKALEWMKYLQDRGYVDASTDLESFRERLERESVIERDAEGGYSLTARGEQSIRKESLNFIFRNLQKGGFGQHRTAHTGEGGERLPETRPYRFGDATNEIDAFATINNAVRRGGIDDIQLNESDLEVFETEHTSSCATVLLIDISHSMILYGEDRITPAKQVALALSELIMTQYPRDSLHVACFGDDAKPIEVKDIPYLRVGPFHTNTKAGLELAQSILRNEKHPNKQVFMITDGKPSAIFEGGRLYKNSHGLDPKIVNQTLNEAAACKRQGITITTFMVTEDPYLVQFVEDLSEINSGRAYFPSLDNLGEAIFADYVNNRRRRVR
jgi:Ca-activated chloride channel family protein